MVQIGRRNLLKVKDISPHGAYLDGENLGDILLPGKFIPRGTAKEDAVDVFIYLDSEDRLGATTSHPRAMAGEFAALEVVAYHPGTGAFLDWGLEKDLLLPIREQSGHVAPGDTVVVFILTDHRSGRLMASMRLDRHLDLSDPPYSDGEAVDLIVAGETPLGYKAIVNHAHWGLLYRNETGSALTAGQQLRGYIKVMRPDGRIDLCLIRQATAG